MKNKKLLKVARTEEFLQTPKVARYNRDRFDAMTASKVKQ